MQNYVSNELTHFVGRSLSSEDEQYALLLRIFRGGMLLDPRYLHGRNSPIFFFDVARPDGEPQRENYYPDPYFEVRENGPVSANEFVAPEMVCFCDIPLGELRIHTSKYSRFGLSFAKQFLVGQGANPVHYVARDAAAPLRLISREGEHPNFFLTGGPDCLLAGDQGRAEFLEKLKFRTFEVISRYSAVLQERFAGYQSGRDDPAEAHAQILGLVEFMTGTFCYVHGMTKVFDPTLSDDDPSNYYMEREWRVIGGVKFTSADVSGVLLPHEFAARFRSDEPTFSGVLTEV